MEKLIFVVVTIVLISCGVEKPEPVVNENIPQEILDFNSIESLEVYLKNSKQVIEVKDSGSSITVFILYSSDMNSIVVEHAVFVGKIKNTTYFSDIFDFIFDIHTEIGINSDGNTEPMKVQKKLKVSISKKDLIYSLKLRQPIVAQLIFPE